MSKNLLVDYIPFQVSEMINESMKTMVKSM